MSKKDKIKNIDMDDLKALPDVLDGRHHVIPIVTGGDEVLEEVNVPEILPILTLRSSVLFPGAITPITVGREKSIRLVREVNERNGLLGAVLQRESEVEDPAPDDMYKVGTAARIIKILEMPNGNLTVILNGLEKIEVKEYVSTEPYFQASVTPLRDSSPDVKSLEFEALVDSIRDVALNIINVSPSMPKEAAFAIKNIDSKRGIINFICSNMELTDEDRQSLLEAPGLLARARKLLEILIREQQLAELKNQIQERVKQEIDKQQRDYYLQQQMRTIQDELGDGADADIEKMREEAKKKNWPKEVGETFEKELQKVERLNPAVAEYSVQMTYLQLLLELPWNEVTKDNLDLNCAREQLDRDHFGLDEVKERILEHLAVIKLKDADASKLTPIEIGDSSKLNVGEWVMAIGSPFGNEQSVSTGIVSALYRSTAMSSTSGNTIYANMIQTDAAINPGNSGGALVNDNGELVGINSLIESYSGSSSGVGFAIPVNYAKNIADQIIGGKTPVHPYMGATLSSVNALNARTNKLSTDSGAYVASVVEDGPAAKAGIQEGDVITKLGDDEITSADGLIIALRSHEVGEKVEITLMRGKEEKKVTVELGSDEELQNQQQDDSSTDTGNGGITDEQLRQYLEELLGQQSQGYGQGY